uniref:Uncharacterized protein n=2 Tax=Moniliophthora roreri TaxID=221103 RepID=A0A0W0F5E7_MONRR
MADHDDTGDKYWIFFTQIRNTLIWLCNPIELLVEILNCVVMKEHNLYIRNYAKIEFHHHPSAVCKEDCQRCTSGLPRHIKYLSKEEYMYNQIAPGIIHENPANPAIQAGEPFKFGDFPINYIDWNTPNPSRAPTPKLNQDFKTVFCVTCNYPHHLDNWPVAATCIPIMFNSTQEGFLPKHNPHGFNKSIKKPFTEASSSVDDPILLKDPWKKEKEYAKTWLNKERNNKAWDSLNLKNPWNARLPPKPQDRPIVKKSEKELQEQ